ncbi:TPA: hypothetical protein IAA92_02315 [Candidatus Galligastranaerophilus intestinigallinarum]|nr:hypothetical protein [Candidatus Galligastranaerophilus intestinigallinarum]
MLPVISEETFLNVIDEVTADIQSWRKSMIHYIKEENPEVNSAIIELANKTGLDPKAVATGAYAIYKMLETAFEEQTFTMQDDE